MDISRIVRGLFWVFSLCRGFYGFGFRRADPQVRRKMHVAKKVFVMEEAVIFGTLSGGFLSVFSDYGNLGAFVLSRGFLGNRP